MDSYVTMYEKSRDSRKRTDLLDRLVRWVDFESRLQSTPNRSGGQGEPKYMISGDAYNGEWGRPQNDGPALRAIVLTRLAQILLDNGHEALVRSRIYGGEIPPRGVTKVDLEYTAHNWSQPSFDLWEEVNGSHFYTRMLQRRALVGGAQLAQRLGDAGAAQFYREQARLLTTALLAHMRDGLLMPTLDRVSGWDHKKANLDVAVVLGALHAYKAEDPFFSPGDDWVISSAEKLEAAFVRLYPINRSPVPAPAIGRYPEDVYDGNGFSGGNPWFLATHAYAEMTCRLADQWESSGIIEINNLNRGFIQRLNQNIAPQGRAISRVSRGEPLFAQLIRAARLRAERYLHRSVRHSHQGADGHMSEQYNRETGFMQGATDLTWSYASYISAYVACYNWLPREL